MACTIIQFPPVRETSDLINISTVQQSCRKLKAGLIAPATEEVQIGRASCRKECRL